MPIITIFTSHSGVLVKKFSLDAGGQIEKYAEAAFYDGRAHDAPANTAHELLFQIQGLSQQQAIGLGNIIGRSRNVALTTSGKEGHNLLSRSTKHFEYQNGPGWLLLDYDDDQMPDAVRDEVDRRGGPLRALFSLLPGLEETGCYLSRRSSSDGVYLPGGPVRESSGIHLYVMLADVRQSRAVLKGLQQRAWSEGLGWLKLNAAGGILVRSIVDISVGSPERLIFEAAPILENGLKRRESQSILREGVPYPVPEFGAAEITKSQVEEDKQRAIIKPEAKKKQKERIDREAEELIKGGTEPNLARRIIKEKLENLVLNDHDILGSVDKRDSLGSVIVVQAGICDGDQLGTRPDDGRGMGVP